MNKIGGVNFTPPSINCELDSIKWYFKWEQSISRINYFCINLVNSNSETLKKWILEEVHLPPNIRKENSLNWADSTEKKEVLKKLD